MGFEEVANNVIKKRIEDLKRSLDEISKEIEELHKNVVEGKIDQRTFETRVSELMKRLRSIKRELRRIVNDPEFITETLRYALEYMRTNMPDAYQLFANALIRARKMTKRNVVRNVLLFVNAGLAALGVHAPAEDLANVLAEVQRRANELKSGKVPPSMLIDYVNAIREAEVYAVTEGIVADAVYGYSYATITLEDIYPYVDADTRKILDFVRKWNPELMTKKFCIIKPRFTYEKPEKIFYLDGKPILAIKDGKVYYPKFVQEGSGDYKVLRMYVPIERVFEEVDGRIKVSAIIRLWSGAEVKYDLFEITVKFRGKHGEVPEPRFKVLKHAVRNARQEIKSRRYRKKLSDMVARKGTRNWMLVSVFVNGKPIDTSLDFFAKAYSKMLGDPKQKQAEYAKKYRSSLILQVERAKNFEEEFGNQEIRVVSRERAEKMYNESRKSRKAAGLIYDRKEKAISEADGYYWIVKHRQGYFNHVIFSEDPFTVLVLEFNDKVYNYIIPSKNGQEFVIVNRHHGEEGKYMFRVKLNLDETIEFVHRIPSS